MTIMVDQNTKLSELIAAAQRDGEVRIKADSGDEYVTRRASSRRSLQELPVLNLQITTDEIMSIVREGRERTYTPRRE